MVPQPFVNPESESYLDISETPFKDRVIDDYLPNQLSIKSFISGGSVGWRVGTSPLLDTRNEQESEN